MRHVQTITLGYQDGKRVRKRIYGNSLKELNRNITKAREEYEDHPYSIIFKDYAEKWLKTYKSTRSKATYNMYVFCLAKTESIDYRLVHEITTPELQEIINVNAEHPRTCEQIELTLKQIFKRAVADGLMKESPCDLTVPARVQTEGRALTKEEKEALKNIELDPMDRIYVDLLYFLGLRPQEATALTVNDFNFKTNEVRIKRAIGYDKNDPYMKSTKVNKARNVPIPDAFVPEVKLYVQETKKRNLTLLIHRDSKPISKKVRDNMWHRIKDKMEEYMQEEDPTLIQYYLRHNYACECYYKHISVLKTSQLMGNSPQVVMKIYTHLDNLKEPIDELKKLTM